MPISLAAGDTVRILDREVLPADVKSQLYYGHYKGLTGTISKIYPDESAVIVIDPQSLPKEISARHNDGTEAMRRKWLDGLSDEARNKLSASEKKFGLRYTVLVATSDLVPEARAAQLPKPEVKALEEEAPPVLARKTLEEMEAEEARHLAEIALKENAE